MTDTKIVGVGKLPRRLAAMILLLVTIIVILNSQLGFSMGAIFAVIAPLIAFVCSLFIQIKVTPTTIVVVSWFRKYVIQRANVETFFFTPYSGVLSRGIELRGPLGFSLQMVAFDLTSRSDFEFPSTIMSRRDALHATQELAAVFPSELL